MPDLLGAQDRKDMRSGVFIGIGTIALTAVVSALGAAWAIVKESDWRVVLILIGVAIFLGFFAIALFLDWRDGRRARPLFRAAGLGDPTPIATPVPVLTDHERKIATMKRALDKAKNDVVRIPDADERRRIEQRIDELQDQAEPEVAPSIEIGLADPPDDGVEGVLEWPHVAVKNVSGRRLTQVHADVLITSRHGVSGTVENLRFDPGDAEYVALEPDFPNNTRTLPLTLRSRENDYAFTTALRHIKVLLAQWECYVTGERFLLNGDQGLRVPPGGDTDLRVRVTFDQDGHAHAWFRVYVPRVEGKPLWVVPLPATRDAQ